jgi:hypothetical protein
MSDHPIPKPADLPPELRPIARYAIALRKAEAKVAQLRADRDTAILYAMRDSPFGARRIARAAGLRAPTVTGMHTSSERRRALED